MFAIVESILPIFLLIVCGHVLRRLPIIDSRAWPGLEQLGYWVLYPALLFTTIARADFSGLRLDAMLAALLGAVGILGGMLLLLWPAMRRLGLVDRSEFSSIFQSSVRWNSFMALALAERLFPAEGIAVVALAMAVIVIPLNTASVVVVTRFGDRAMNWRRLALALAANPMIVATLAGLAFHAFPLVIYGPAETMLDLMGRAALGMGLLTIGAGLRPADMLSPRTAIWLPVALKLLICPALIVGMGWLLGVRGPELAYLALCGAVPTAMNGYLLARQLGGDAELYAAVTTLQTAAAFVTIPLALLLTGYVISG